MGGKNSGPVKHGKNIVIVGGSLSGYNVAGALYNDHHVTIIDKRDHFDFFVCIPRAYAVKNYYD
jgi:hypothetical protein